MKTTIILFLFTVLTVTLNAQSQRTFSQNSMDDLPVISVMQGSTLHIVSPEPIQYVDISTSEYLGDLPVENVLRLKLLQDTVPLFDKGEVNYRNTDAIVTLVGQSFYAQYKVKETFNASNVTSSIEVLPQHTRQLDFPDITLTNHEMKSYSLDVIRRKRTFHNVTSKTHGMVAWLNNIYAYGDYIFLDISFLNKSKLKYDIDQFRFNIKDKKITKATNVQDIEIVPVFSLYDQPYFKKEFRNVFVFKKFTYPNGKILSIQLAEDQYSGRTIELNIDYRDLLNADTL